MGKEKATERFGDFTLVRKTKPVTSSDHGKPDIIVNASAIATSDFENIKSESLSASALESDNVTLKVKPELLDIHHE